MRKIGDITQKICWKLQISVNNNIVYENEYSTLKDIAEELGYSYNIVSEMVMGRKKNRKGKYDTQYSIKKIADC
tara:strand:- start:4849 stop:5070 length:222 start_codon:yes stop_codon:yes gene_type:complete